MMDFILELMSYAVANPSILLEFAIKVLIPVALVAAFLYMPRRNDSPIPAAKPVQVVGRKVRYRTRSGHMRVAKVVALSGSGIAWVRRPKHTTSKPFRLNGKEV